MKRFYILIFTATLAMAIAGCDNDGPAEQAGEKVDTTMEKMGNQIEDACEEAKEGANLDNQDC